MKESRVPFAFYILRKFGERFKDNLRHVGNEKRINQGSIRRGNLS